MFFKFEGKSASHTIEARKYTVVHPDKNTEFVRVIVWTGECEETTAEFLLHRSGVDWFRCYVMNNEGKTIDKIYAPENF